jgi:hypothetical protein
MQQYQSRQLHATLSPVVGAADRRPHLSVKKRKAGDELTQWAAQAAAREARSAKRAAARPAEHKSEFVRVSDAIKNRLEASRYRLLFANLWVSPAVQMRLENVLVQHGVHDTIDLAQLSDAAFAVLHRKLDGGLFADRVHKVRCTLQLSQSQ